MTDAPARTCVECGGPPPARGVVCSDCWLRSPLTRAVTVIAPLAALEPEQLVVIQDGYRDRQVARVARRCGCNTPTCDGYFVWAADFGRDVLTYYDRHDLARLDGVTASDLPQPTGGP
ncbi:MAG: hypothetical protein M3Q39_16795 [Actinomycetota bacterium]|nr:hypothetical protein [Actinomycetota bacterium]